MTATTNSFSVSNLPIRPFEKVGNDAPVTESPNTDFKIIQLTTTPVRPVAPKNFAAIGDLIKSRETDPRRAAALAAARNELANEHQNVEGNTVKSRRLELGYSQVKVAELTFTSQSHIARIERGTERINIDTCRKLCAALEVDMNRLNELLQTQEWLAKQRGR